MWFASLKFTKIHTGSNFLQDYKHSALHLLAHSYALAHRAGMERNSKLKHLGRHEQCKCNLSLEIKCCHQRKLTKSWNYFKPFNLTPVHIYYVILKSISAPFHSIRALLIEKLQNPSVAKRVSKILTAINSPLEQSRTFCGYIGLLYRMKRQQDIVY